MSEQPGRSRPYRHETRRRVVDAAFEVFSEQGIAATSLNAVAAAGGLTKGAVYSNFASKDELVLALMEEHAGHRIEVGLAGFRDGDGGTPWTEMAAALVREMRADAAWHRLLAEYFAMTRRDPGRREALRERRREVRAAIARVITAVAAGLDYELPIPADELAVVLLAFSNGLAMETDIDPDGVPADLLGRVLTLMLGDAVTKVRDAVGTGQP